jgi:hypothetical protein
MVRSSDWDSICVTHMYKTGIQFSFVMKEKTRLRYVCDKYNGIISGIKAFKMTI